jgi:hypothetical protein
MSIVGNTAVSLAAKGMFSESEKDALIKLMSDLRVSWPNVKFKLFGSKVKRSLRPLGSEARAVQTCRQHEPRQTYKKHQGRLPGLC